MGLRFEECTRIQDREKTRCTISELKRQGKSIQYNKCTLNQSPQKYQQ